MLLNDAGPVSGMASILLAAGPCGKNNQELPWDTALPKKDVWNFQALEIPAFIGLGEFQTLFFGQSPGTRNFRNLRHEACGIRSCVIQSISANGGKTHGPQSNHHYPRP